MSKYHRIFSLAGMTMIGATFFTVIVVFFQAPIANASNANGEPGPASQAQRGEQLSQVQVQDVLSETARLVYLPLVSTDGIAIYPEWIAAWWQWIESVNNTPLYQSGYVDCGLAQSGDVWFLAGTDGTAPADRRCAVTVGKTLLIPLQTSAWANEYSENLTISEKRTVLDAVYSDTEPGILNSEICHLAGTVDGEPRNYSRIASTPFLRWGDPEAVADGYWLALRPSLGEHEVKIAGTLCTFGTDSPLSNIQVTYHLSVELPKPEPSEPWKLFVWDTDANPIATGCSPKDPNGVIPCDAVNLGRNSVYGGTPPWTFATTSDSATVTVVDTANGGDEYEVFNHGQSLGRTSRSDEDAYCAVPYGGDPGVCLETEGVSSGIFQLGAGSHSITIVPVRAPFGFGYGYLRFDYVAE